MAGSVLTSDPQACPQYGSAAAGAGARIPRPAAISTAASNALTFNWIFFNWIFFNWVFFKPATPWCCLTLGLAEQSAQVRRFQRRRAKAGGRGPPQFRRPTVSVARCWSRTDCTDTSREDRSRTDNTVSRRRGRERRSAGTLAG